MDTSVSGGKGGGRRECHGSAGDEIEWRALDWCKIGRWRTPS